MLSKMYIEVENVLKQYYGKQVAENKKELLKNSATKELLKYIENLIPDKSSCILLMNINYIIIVWEYCTKIDKFVDLDLYKDFLDILYKDIDLKMEKDNTNKLMYLLMTC